MSNDFAEEDEIEETGPMAAAGGVLEDLLDWCLSEGLPQDIYGDLFPGAWNDDGPIGRDFRQAALEDELQEQAALLTRDYGVSLTPIQLETIVRQLATMIEVVGRLLRPMRNWPSSSAREKDDAVFDAMSLTGSPQVEQERRFGAYLADKVGPSPSWTALADLIESLLVKGSE